MDSNANNNRTNSEYLWVAMLFIAVAIMIVLLIVVSSCKDSAPNTSSEAVASISSVISDDGDDGDDGDWDSDDSESSDESSESSANVTTDTSSEPSSESEAPVSVPTEDFTVEVRSSEKSKGILALINASNAEENQASENDLAEVPRNGDYDLKVNANTFLRADALDALVRLVEGFREADSDALSLHRAYLPYSTDLSSKNREFVTGYSVYLTNYKNEFGVETHLWIPRNAYRYGYILRYHSVNGEGGEPHYYRYVGREHAAYMKDTLSLEEYLAAVHEHSIDSPLMISYTDEQGNGKQCAVYYVPASDGEKTSIRILGNRNAKYSISGNGSDGFIVTCYLN